MPVRNRRPRPRRSDPRPKGAAREVRVRRPAEAEETLRAIRTGEVDALVIPGPRGDQVYTLKDADRPYRFIVEKIRDGTATFDRNGTILFANKQFAAMLGRPLARIMGDCVHDYVSGVEARAFRRLLGRGHKRAARAEIDFLTASGGLLTCNVSLSPIRIEGTTVAAGVFTDVTREKQLRTSLQSTTAVLERIFGGTRILIALLDKSLRFIRVNPNFARAVGRSDRSLTGRKYQDVFPESKNVGLLVRVLETGQPVGFEAAPFERGLRPGKPSCWDWNVEPVRDPEGAVESLILTLIDKTEQSASEQERRRLAAAVEQAADGIAIVDREGNVLSSNHALKSILTEAGQSPDDLRPARMLSEPFRRVQEVLRRRAFWKGHVTRTGRRGLPYSLDITVSPLREAGSDPEAYVLLLRDMTQSVRLEQKVRQMERLEALGRLAGGVAHDLNNILQPMLVNTETVLSELDSGSRQAERLRNVLLAVQRQKDLVRGILSFTRRQAPDRRPAPFRAVLAEVLRLLGPSFPASVEVRVSDDVPRDMIRCNRTEVHQVILNLCTNALEAMSGRSAGRLDISLANARLEDDDPSLDLPAGEYLKLSVADTGRGMPPEVLSHVFEPFFTTKEGGRGTGIGLSVVHGIMQSCGGVVEIESRPDHGTRVDLYFPLSDEAAVPASLEARSEFRPEGQRILLVDDEALVLDSLGRALQSRGFSVTTAKDGVEALEAFKAAPGSYDLVIVDQTMPRLTGMQVAAEMLRLKAGMPIILATGFSAIIDETRAKEMGLREILTKPVSLRELIAAVSRALSRSGS